jgi:hypothetical protein
MTLFYLPILLFVPAVAVISGAGILIHQNIAERELQRRWQRGFPLYDTAPTPVELLRDDDYPNA